MNRAVVLVVGVTGVVTGAIGLIGALAVNRVRRASLVVALVVAALVPFVAVVLSVWVSVGAMFISGHDALVARLALGTSAVPAVGLALILGRLLLADLRIVGEQARALGAEDPVARMAPMTAELAGLVTELAETRQRLAASRDRERTLESSRRQIVAFVSHDLRSPLAGIRATVEGLQDGVFADVGAALAGVESAVDRMGRMIEDLAELSRADGGVLGRSAQPVELAGLLEDVVAQAAPAARTQGVHLKADLTPGLCVIGVRDELARVLDNLVDNAVRNSGRGGTVQVVGRLVAGEVRVAVTDTCGGIPPADLDRIFNKGWQGTAHGATGSDGLGLAIVGEVVAAHGGRVAVEPTAVGCLFRVSLPTEVAASLR